MWEVEGKGRRGRVHKKEEVRGQGSGGQTVVEECGWGRKSRGSLAGNQGQAVPGQPARVEESAGAAGTPFWACVLVLESEKLGTQDQPLRFPDDDDDNSGSNGSSTMYIFAGMHRK